jgi:DNA-binding transcriptional ArsR family regulator
VVDFAAGLAKRLRTYPQPLYPPSEKEFCCSVGKEEERSQPKTPAEILPLIQTLKMQWQRADDPGPSDPQQLVDDLWADMVPLGWPLPACPKLPETQTPAFLTDPPTHKYLWREYQLALSQVETLAREHTDDSAIASMAIAEHAIALPNNNSDDSALEGEAVEDEQDNGDPHCETKLKQFTGGEMVFSKKCVKLCGVDICSGPRCQTRRKILDLLRQKKDDGSFVSYSGEVLAKELESEGNEGKVAGAIRDLRNDTVKALSTQASISCSREDVILSGGPGYRLANCITVRIDGEVVSDEQSDISDMDNVTNGGTDDVTSDSTSSAEERSHWILEQLRSKVRLKRSDIAKHFSCTERTAQRDLNSLKDAGKIEFIGSPRTGYYRLYTTPADSP